MTDARPSRRGTSTLAVAFVVTAAAAFFAMRWNLLEQRRGLPMGTKVMFGTAMLAAGCSRLVGRSPTKATILVVGVAVPAGALVSMVVEMVKDPTSGNLWPVAVVVLGIFALAASAIGSFVGGLILYLGGAKAGTDGGS